MNHGPTFSFTFLILAVTLVGFLNGCCIGLLFRQKRWYLWGLGGAVLLFASEEAYSWYRLAYIDAGRIGTGLGYGSCAVIIAAIAALIPLAVLTALSFSRRCYQARAGRGSSGSARRPLRGCTACPSAMRRRRCTRCR